MILTFFFFFFFARLLIESTRSWTVTACLSCLKAGWQSTIRRRYSCRDLNHCFSPWCRRRGLRKQSRGSAFKKKKNNYCSFFKLELETENANRAIMHSSSNQMGVTEILLIKGRLLAVRDLTMSGMAANRHFFTTGS